MIQLEKASEYGSNANGEYWKFANGLMICKGSTSISFKKGTAWGSVFYDSWYGTISFPMTFIEVPMVFFSFTDMNVINIVSGNLEIGAIKSLLATFAESIARDVDIKYLAVGRWK